MRAKPDFSSRIICSTRAPPILRPSRPSTVGVAPREDVSSIRPPPSLRRPSRPPPPQPRPNGAQPHQALPPHPPAELGGGLAAPYIQGLARPRTRPRVTRWSTTMGEVCVGIRTVAFLRAPHIPPRLFRAGTKGCITCGGAGAGEALGPCGPAFPPPSPAFPPPAPPRRTRPCGRGGGLRRRCRRSRS